MSRFLAALAFLLLLPGCLADAMYGHLPSAVRMEPAVYPLSGLNGPYDDFNAVAGPPPLAMDAFIAFASNDASYGGRFSIDAGHLTVLQNPFPDRSQSRPPAPAITARRTGVFSLIPSLPGNVRGPTPLVSQRVEPRDYALDFDGHPTRSLTLNREPLPFGGGGALPKGAVWMFDSDHKGRRNLYFTDGLDRVRPFFGNADGADDAYATYDFKRHELLFSSNRSGSFRLYRYKNVSQDMNFPRWLANAALTAGIEPVAELDAAGETMAPFVCEDALFFASNRPGGRGGFDLYVSQRTQSGWGPPRNLQDLFPTSVPVNTAGNEFRPSVLLLGFEEKPELRLLLFSSDRPGGMGGYDLYLTSLPGF
jgi:hypothetical protein